MHPISTTRSRREYITAGLASMMGTTIEWYDFFCTAPLPR